MPLYHKCVYKDCNGTPNLFADRSFHRFPTDPEHQLKWIEVVGVPKLSQLTPRQLLEKRICSAHFNETDFINFDRTRGRRILKGFAVPIASVETVPEIPTAAEQTDPGESTLPTEDIAEEISSMNPDSPSPGQFNGKTHDGSQSFLTVEKTVAGSQSSPQVTYVKVRQPTYHEQKLLKKNASLTEKLKRARQTIRNLNRRTGGMPSISKVISGAAHYMDGNRLLLTTMQLNHIKHAPWSKEEKQFALDLYDESPDAYLFLRDIKKITLPCETLIRQWNNELDSASSN